MFCLVASAPTNLKFEVQSEATNVLLAWTPPSPLGDTTGYSISFSGGGISGSVTIDNGSSNNYTLTGLTSGETYEISISGTSEHFFSVIVEWETVVLVAGEHIVSKLS